MAWIGSDAKIHSTGTDITVKATRVASTFSRSDGGAGGIFASGVLMKTVTAITGAVKAYVDDNATVGTDAGLNPGRPARLLVQAKDDANAAATATVGSGAIGFTAAASDAEATASPTVDAHVGKNATLTISETPNANTCGFGSNPPTANVCILAVSDDAEADANAESYSGSVGIQVGEPEATATSNPVANAYIGDGTVVVTGGNVIVQAESNANKPDPNKTFGDNITAVTPDGSSGTPTTSCGFAEDSVCYTAHGLITGSQVKYVVDGGTLIDGLVANHLYTVIVVDDNTLRFGDTFSGQSANADTIVIGAMGVDGNRSMVRFATPHNFETGDAVIYRNTGYTPDRGTWASHTDYANGDFVIDFFDGKLYRAKGTTADLKDERSSRTLTSTNWAVVGISADFHEGQVLFVGVIDPYTIELYTTKTSAISAADVFSAGSVDSTNHTIENSDLADGTRVTYKNSAPLVFDGVSSDNTGTNPPDFYGLVNADVALRSA